MKIPDTGCGFEFSIARNTYTWHTIYRPKNAVTYKKCQISGMRVVSQNNLRKGSSDTFSVKIKEALIENIWFSQRFN